MRAWGSAWVLMIGLCACGGATSPTSSAQVASPYARDVRLLCDSYAASGAELHFTLARDKVQASYDCGRMVGQHLVSRVQTRRGRGLFITLMRSARERRVSILETARREVGDVGACSLRALFEATLWAPRSGK